MRRGQPFIKSHKRKERQKKKKKRDEIQSLISIIRYGCMLYQQMTLTVEWKAKAV